MNITKIVEIFPARGAATYILYPCVDPVIHYRGLRTKYASSWSGGGDNRDKIESYPAHNSIGSLAGSLGDVSAM